MLLINILITIIFVLVSVAFYTIAERKLLASIQRRRGPNVVGFWGVFQAFADGLKLLLKEVVLPSKANSALFLLAPALTFLVGLAVWVFIPFSGTNYLTNFDLSLLWVYAISSLGVYGVIGAGWSSNSRYAFLGGLRSAAQLISYEVSVALLFLPVAASAGSFNLIEIVKKQEIYGANFFILFPLFVIFFISVLAETNRAPFDLP